MTVEDTPVPEASRPEIIRSPRACARARPAAPFFRSKLKNEASSREQSAMAERKDPQGLRVNQRNRADIPLSTGDQNTFLSRHRHCASVFAKMSPGEYRGPSECNRSSGTNHGQLRNRRWPAPAAPEWQIPVSAHFPHNVHCLLQIPFGVDLGDVG